MKRMNDALNKTSVKSWDPLKKTMHGSMNTDSKPNNSGPQVNSRVSGPFTPNTVHIQHVPTVKMSHSLKEMCSMGDSKRDQIYTNN